MYMIKWIICLLIFLPFFIQGQEKISNGTFDSDTDWTIINSGWSIGSGVASHDGVGNSYLKQDAGDMVSDLEDSKSYVFNY